MLLEKINSASDIQKMSFDELNLLALEIRQFLIDHVSQTGGHLASNLGAVELTIAIHNIFDTSKDRLVFDVGHQSYVHKMLTGRRDQFETLRQYGGIAGFPKPSESVHDAFTAGHASSAVSTALGMARARTLKGEDYQVIALVGDGAMTGGLFYEGMNDAGASKEPLIVILNDNGMSIQKNVGGISKHLSLVRLKPGYFGLKRKYHHFIAKVPGGKHLYNVTHRIKERLKKSLIGTTLFEEMGFAYLGPVDGHDIHKLSYLLERAKELKCPVVVHAITVKGKGYPPAERSPGAFHGVGPFNPVTGCSQTAKAQSFSEAFGQALTALASKEPRICAITAAMTQGTGLDLFAYQFPKRFFDVGIAEGHAVSMASGLAKQGMIPVVAVYSTFLQRSYDMMMQDVALQNLHVVFAVDRSGLVGEDGETHHGVMDVGYLRQVPGMAIYSPSSLAELKTALSYAVLEENGPAAVRYPRGSDGVYSADFSGIRLKEGRDVTILTYGREINEVLSAAELLTGSGISAEILKPLKIAPLDLSEIAASVKKTGCLIVAEETNEAGAIGNEVIAQLAGQGIRAIMHGRSLGNRYFSHGKTEQLLKDAGLDGASLAGFVQEVLQNEA